MHSRPQPSSLSTDYVHKKGKADKHRTGLLWSRKSNNSNTADWFPCTERTAIFESIVTFPPAWEVSRACCVITLCARGKDWFKHTLTSHDMSSHLPHTLGVHFFFPQGEYFKIAFHCPIFSFSSPSPFAGTWAVGLTHYCLLSISKISPVSLKSFYSFKVLFGCTTALLIAGAI